MAFLLVGGTMLSAGTTAARIAAVLAFLSFLTSSTTYAQSATGELQGTIVNGSGAVLPGVTVTITNRATNAAREVLTDDEGFFAVPGLPVGPYEVQASLQGYATRRQPEVGLHVGEVMRLRIELRVAPAPETITIAETPRAIETTRSHASSLVDFSDLQNLPVRRRNAMVLALLTPGATCDESTKTIGFAGQLGALNRLLVDGLDHPDLLGGPIQMSADALQEFQVNSDAYPAEYGRAGAAVVNVVTRSGANELAGSAFHFHGNDALNGNTTLNEQVGLPKPQHRSNRFGGVVGGPLVEDKHFFFGSYEGQRDLEPNTVFLNLPADTPRDGDTQAALSRLRPLAMPWEGTQNRDAFFVRTDHQLSDGQRVTLRYDHQNFTGRDVHDAGTQIARESTGDTRASARGFAVTAASAIGPALFNEVRVLAARDRATVEPRSNTPQATIRQFGSDVLRIGREVFSDQDSTVKRLQIADTITWVRGAHELKTGVDAHIGHIVSSVPGHFSGTYVFDTLAAFNRGIPGGSGNAYIQAFETAGTPGRTARPDTHEFSLFAGDQWHPTQALTLNLGVRYDLQTFAQPDAFNTDTNNIGPRLGLAWAPTNRRYVVRAGYGVVHGRTPWRMAAAAYANDGINVQTITFRGASGDPLPTFPARFSALPAGLAARPSIVTFDPDYQNARMQHASSGIEWEWMPHTSVSVTYLFIKGDHLPRATDVNVGAATGTVLTLADASGRRTATVPSYRFVAGPFPNFARVISFESTADSRYDGLTIELHRRWAQGQQYRLAYTLGRVEDTMPYAAGLVPESTDDRGIAPSPAGVDANRAVGDHDRRHRFVGSAIYSSNVLAERFKGFKRRFLSDWMLGVIYTAQSGRPYSAYAGGDVNGDHNRFNDLAPGTTRNQFRLPASFSLDPRIARTVALNGDNRLTFIWEAFNLLNRPSYSTVDNILYDVVGTELRENPLFGRPLQQLNPRMMQVAVKFSF